MSADGEGGRGKTKDKLVSMRALSPKAVATRLSRNGEQDRRNDTNAGAQIEDQEIRLGISPGLS